MPKKIKKTHEEKTAEEYFPIDERNLRYTTEKQVKTIVGEKVTTANGKNEELIFDRPRMTVEKKYKRHEQNKVESVEITNKKKYRKSKRKSLTKKIASKKKEKKIKFIPEKISLKKDGYELIITEKPQAASKIASALGKQIQRNFNKVSYYEVDRDGRKIFVVCAIGHLFTLKQNERGYSIPTFDIRWVPNYLVLKNDFTRRYYDTISKIVKNAGSITVATDFDVEGEVIGLNVVRFICGQEDANRMKFSTLTNDELNEAYEKKSPNLEWGNAIAGETRHYLDWFYGINLSRALMYAIKTTGRFKIMSIGRVQGPALNLIVTKEREIQKFKPTPYWQVFITVKNSHKIELKYNKDITKKQELKKFENLVGKTVQAETKKTEQILHPNPPFNLTSLQTEAYKLYGITPSRTLQIAQSLYLSGLISYPRTSSEKLPDSINYKSIKEKLSKEYKFEKLMMKEKPIQGKKSDPAHPSIYPTGNRQILSGEEEKIYNLIVKRFLSLFCEDAIIDNKKIIAKVDNMEFSVRGSSIRKKAWMEIYPTYLKEKEIPDLDGEVKIVDSRIEEKETQPPKRYSPASIISELEKRNLGTKATRASILETLYDRGYIKEKSIEATPLGMSLIETLEKHSPIIIDEELTRNFEKEMEKIQNANEDFEEKEKKVLEKAKVAITKIAQDFEKEKEQIGKELLKANIVQIEKEKEANKLNVCPLCKKGMLGITYSPKTKRNFIACDAYPNCKNTYSLPPGGLIKKSDKICERCGFPMLMSLKKGKHPWIFCFNPDCPTNKERIEEYRKRKEEEKEVE